jgi:hypothetical protein
VLSVSGVSEVGLDCGEKVRLKKFQAVITEYCREGWGGGGEVVDGAEVEAEVEDEPDSWYVFADIAVEAL